MFSLHLYRCLCEYPAFSSKRGLRSWMYGNSFGRFDGILWLDMRTSFW
jgi:hypothetical protein